MPIFHEANLIHIHNPRCGGTSINHTIREALAISPKVFNAKRFSYHYLYGNHNIGGNKYELDHLTYSMILETTSSWIQANYFAFVVVRHPWDRFVSEYIRKVAMNSLRFIDHRNISFDQYCNNFLSLGKNNYNSQSPCEFRGLSHFASCHYLPQYLFTGLDQPLQDLKPTVVQLDHLNEWWGEISAYCPNLDGTVLKRSSNSHKDKISDNIKDQIANVKPSLAQEVEQFYSKDYELLAFSPKH